MTKRTASKHARKGLTAASFAAALALASSAAFAQTAPEAPAANDALDAVLTTRCQPDARLVRVADRALASAEESGSLDGEALAATAREQRLAAASVRAWVGRSETQGGLASAAGEWLARQRVRRAWARCAWSAAQGERGARALVVVPRAAEVEVGGTQVGTLDVAPRTPVALRTTLPRGARAAEWLALGPDGSVRHIGNANGTVMVRFEDPGAWRMQLVAESDEGPLPFAALAVQVGPRAAARAASDDDEPAPAPPELHDARDVRTAINRARVQRSLTSLRPDPALEELARERAARLAEYGAVAHRLAPEGTRDGTPEQRLRTAGLRAARVAENVARARTLTEAYARLADSPAHRAIRLEPGLDALGVGVVARGEWVYVVELYAAQPSLVAERAEDTDRGAEDTE